MGKVVLLTDTHIGARSDSLVFDNYFQKFFNDILFPTLKREKIKTIFHLGDVFDRRKYINFNILNRFRNNFLHPLENMGVNMFVLSGNHDVFFRNTNDVNSIQEIMGGWDNITVINEPKEMIFDGLKLLLLPWITNDNLEETNKLISNTSARVLFGHLQIHGFQMYGGINCEDGLDGSMFHQFDMVISGHFHHKSSNDNIHYLGAPYEMTFADMNDPRGFHILDTKTLSMEFIENPYRMFHRVVYDDRGKTIDEILNSIEPTKYSETYIKVIVNYKSNPFFFDKFIDMLYGVSPAEIKIIEDFNVDVDSGETSTEDTLSILFEYVDSMELVMDKTKLKEILRGIYLEATNEQE